MNYKKKLTANKKYYVNSNISERKNSMTWITQNRRISLFSLRSFNQIEAGNKRCKNICLMKRKMFFMIAQT